MSRKVLDIESNGLLNHETIDYLASPYRLKPTFRIWYMSIRDIDNPMLVQRYVGEKEIERWIDEELPNVTELVAHNGIDFDFLALKAYFTGKFEYYIDHEDSHNCTINGRKIRIVDTLVLSKVLNPDRYGGHSLDEWGRRVGSHKIDWRAQAIELGLIEHNAPPAAEFQQWHPAMGEYCDQDTLTNVHAYNKMMQEWGDWPWEGPFSLEQAVRDIVTRQSHRGFWFDQELAQANIRELDQKMEEIRQIVEPLIPPKKMGVTKLKNFIGPVKPFKKDGTPSSHMVKFAEKHGGSLEQREEDWWLLAYGKEWKLPLGNTPIQTHEPATVKDVSHIKGWLIELGWKPTAYKERDLTCDAKKNKLSREKFEEVVERYVEQTLNSPFCRDRCAELGTTRQRLKAKLLVADLKRPLKVYTNPTITVGTEKQIDPALEALAEKFPHAKLISDYLTYSHRRNSILGGGQTVDGDFDEEDEDNEYSGKGWLAVARLNVDGRIPTPADTLGAATSRMRHKLVVNVPRVTSLYGEKMRALFGVDEADPVVQMGYDFSSLESRIEAHYCWRYDEEDRAYCKSLLMEKPLDVHTLTAKKVSAVIGQEFGRTPAKTTKYACAYGASPKRVAKTVGCSEELGEKIHAAYWEAAKPLGALSEKLKHYWTTTGGKKFILGVDGRKVPTRAASALINSLFQSAGSICAKKAMVLHDRKLSALGLTVDFFRDDWKNKVYVQQLISMHDEVQLEVHKSLVKWKLFSTEEEASVFLKSSSGWSTVGHSEKGYFVGKSVVADLAVEAVNETSIIYKLNVPLGIEFIFGRTWAECH